jgi:hypothetical protein
MVAGTAIVRSLSVYTMFSPAAVPEEAAATPRPGRSEAAEENARRPVHLKEIRGKRR